MKFKLENVIGLIPAAGEGKRIQPIPFSKEMFPIKVAEEKNGIKVISCFLMDQFEKAEINKAIFVIKSGKWDIPKFWGEKNPTFIRLGFIVIKNSNSVPETIDNAYPFVKDNIVAFGFPDLIIEPENVYSELLEKLNFSEANIVLGLFPVENPSKFDMVEFDKNNNINNIAVKPSETELKYAWTIAVWDQKFSGFIHNWLKRNKKSETKDELQLSTIIIDAINQGLKIDSVIFETGKCIDIGTMEDLNKAINLLNNK